MELQRIRQDGQLVNSPRLWSSLTKPIFQPFDIQVLSIDEDHGREEEEELHLGLFETLSCERHLYTKSQIRNMKLIK